MTKALRGMLERADRLGVSGWAARGADAVTLEVFVGARAVAVSVADEYRADLVERDGACAFTVWFADALPLDHDVTLRVCTPDGADLPGSPRSVPALALGGRGQRLADSGAPLALVVDEAAPDAARDAGSVALLSHMAALRRLGFAVTFVALDAARPVFAATAGRVRVAWLHRLRPMALLAAELRHLNPGVRVVWSVADLAHLRAQRQARVLGGVPPIGLPAAERACAASADAVATHSPAEAALLERLHPRPRAHWVPWSVAVRPEAAPFASRHGVAFLGSYGHAPNADAARVMVEGLMPLVWRHAPDMVCVLAGSGAPQWLRRCTESDRRLRLLPSLADTAALWAQVRVSAAPLRFGAGVKGKVLDSLAAGVPCVCSPMAAEGLALPSVLQAADPAAMAAALLRLHADAAANAAAAAAGSALLAARHSEAVVDRAMAWTLAPH